MGGFVLISDAEIQDASYTLPSSTEVKNTQQWLRSAPRICYVLIKPEKHVKYFVEKYFFDTPERPRGLDTSIFLEGELYD